MAEQIANERARVETNRVIIPISAYDLRLLSNDIRKSGRISYSYEEFTVTFVNQPSALDKTLKED